MPVNVTFPISTIIFNSMSNLQATWLTLKAVCMASIGYPVLYMYVSVCMYA